MLESEILQRQCDASRWCGILRRGGHHERGEAGDGKHEKDRDSTHQCPRPSATAATCTPGPKGPGLLTGPGLRECRICVIVSETRPTDTPGPRGPGLRSDIEHARAVAELLGRHVQCVQHR